VNGAHGLGNSRRESIRGVPANLDPTMTASEPRSRAVDEGTYGGAGDPPAAAANATGARTETVAFESAGVRCEADLYLPAAGEPPWPAVVMAHVFGAERAWGLAPFAERFARAGVAALAFDYRHLGGSEGTPRRLIDTGRQRDDWDAALAYVRSLEEVDADRVAAWGSSFSGGHALEVACRDHDVRAVVAQVPFVDGRSTVAHQTSDRSTRSRLGTMARAVADRVLAVADLGPVSVPLVSEPGGGGLVDSPGAEEGFLSLVPEGEEPVNSTPARVVLDLPFFRPGRRADEVDVPVHLVVGEEDRLLPRGPTERTIDRLPDPSVHRVPTGHFGVHYDPWFEPVVEAQVAFLTEALGVDR